MPIWTSQVTHTAVKRGPNEVRSATYTLGAGSPLIYALGTVFDAKNGKEVDPYHPSSRTELGHFADERVARAVCEAFCAGLGVEQLSEVARNKTVELAAIDAANTSSKAGPS